MNLANSTFSMNLGRILSGSAPTPPFDPYRGLLPDLFSDDRRPVFRLSAQQIATHMSILGPTGAGKSRLLWQMMREHRQQRRGFCVIDDGDLANDFLADCASEVLLNGRHSLLKKLYWIKLNPYGMARYDPWNVPAPEGLHPELLRNYQVCSRHKRVQQFMQVTQANVTGKTDFMNQPRRQRVLTNVFSALSIAVEERHLAMEDVFIFFDPNHKHWRRTMDRCIPFLANEVVQDLEMLGAFKNRPGDLWQQIESSVNSLRALLGPCMKQMLSATGNEPCFDWKTAVQQGGYVIIDAHQEFAGPGENVALASLMALDLGEMMLTTPKHKRKPFTLIVDEAAQFLGPLGREFGRWLRIMRKYGMPCILAFQDVASMKLDDLDLAPVILGQCGTLICFRSRWNDDNEILARLLLTGNFKFVPLVHDVYEARGEYDWIRVQETTRSESHSANRSSSRGITQTRADSFTETKSDSQQRTGSRGEGDGRVYDAHGKLISVSRSGNHGDGRNDGHSIAKANGIAVSDGRTESETSGSTDGWSQSVGEKLVPLPVIVHDIQKTGQLEESIADQNERHRQFLHGLEDRHAVVLAPGMTMAIEIVTLDVPEPFQSASMQANAVKWIENEICKTHAFYFVPSFDPAEQDQRVQRFLDGDLREGATSGPAAPDQRPQTDPRRGDFLAAPVGKDEPFEE